MSNDNNTAVPAPAAPSATMAPAAPPAAAAAPVAQPKKRRAALFAVAGLTVLAGLAYGGYWAVYLRHYETTDNAYVNGPVVQLTPQVGGTVISILADDTDSVKAGQPIVKLDPADARLALDRAEAQLAQTVREVRTTYTNNDALSANIRSRQADLARMRSDVARAQDDVNRRRPLALTGAVGGEEMKHAEDALAVAKAALTGAESSVVASREQATSNLALTEGTTVEQHPNVLRAASAVREAYLALQRTELPAPIDGEVARRTVQVGQRVAAGAPLMSIVPLQQIWVDANFKEVQLRRMRIGQPVKLTADLYGGKVEYDGRVAGLGAGTGAAFALLPAQNATGNWIKVVQRLPVRLEIDAKQLAEHPLRVGLSMEVTVDIANDDGKPVTAGPANTRTTTTQAFEYPAADADRVVNDIITANLGKAASTAKAGKGDAQAANSQATGAKPSQASSRQPPQSMNVRPAQASGGKASPVSDTAPAPDADVGPVRKTVANRSAADEFARATPFHRVPLNRPLPG